MKLNDWIKSVPNTGLALNRTISLTLYRRVPSGGAVGIPVALDGDHRGRTNGSLDACV